MPIDSDPPSSGRPLPLRWRPLLAGLMSSWAVGLAGAAALAPALQGELDRAVVTYESGRLDEAYRQLKNVKAQNKHVLVVELQHRLGPNATSRWTGPPDTAAW